MADQGMIEFGNIPRTSVVAGSFTIGHGIAPSTATMTTVPLKAAPKLDGTLTISYGSTKLKFVDCRIVDVKQVMAGGEILWQWVIKDRRWKWRFGRVRGRYNYRLPPANRVEPIKEKKPTELLKIAFGAMGETAPAVFKNVPDETRPFCDWDDLPASAAQRIIEQLSCRIWIDPQSPTNAINVGKVGVGNQLPNLPEITSDTATSSPPQAPDIMRFMGAPTLYQDDLELEPVAQEVDGRVFPINQVSYGPPSGVDWMLIDPYEMKLGDRRESAIAEKTVWHWYRIKYPVKNNWMLDIPLLRYILPLQSTLLQTYEVNGDIQPLPAMVYGEWEGSQTDLNFAEDEIVGADGNKYQRMRGGWSLDAERGIVIFSNPTYLAMNCKDTAHPVPKDGNTNPAWIGNMAAKLWLRCSFSIRDIDTEAWKRRFVDRVGATFKPGKKNLVHYVVREDEQAMFYWLRSTIAIGPWSPLLPQTNIIEFDKAANYYLDLEQLKFVNQLPASKTYAGIHAIPLDGACQSVTWTINRDGTAYTTANRNREDLSEHVTYREREQIELLAQLKRGQNEDLSNPTVDWWTGKRKFGLTETMG